MGAAHGLIDARRAPLPPVEVEWTMKTISSHADYRHKDYFFERTQSRAMQARQWEQTKAPIRSWSDILVPALAAMGALAAVAEIIH
jgi:hypothetical protein